MAIINNNVQNIQFLRNQTPYTSREAALTAIEAAKANAIDGTSLLARYSGGTVGEDFFINTIVGYVAVNGNDKYLTIIDVEGSSADVEELKQEINAKLGNGVGSGASETVTAQLTALSGNTASTSAETSVEGAKRYAEDLISELDGSVSAETGYYVKSVSEVDGKIAGTTAALPTVADEASAKTFVTSVSENLGEIAVTKGTITSAGETIVLTDNADGGVNFEVHYDGTTIIQDPDTKELKVAGSALIQYEGDDDTVQISAPVNNVRTVSSPLTIQKVTTGLSEEVKEEYHLVGASGTTIGDPVKIYKDSHIVSITYITDTGDTHYQNLEYVYLDASGTTKTEYVDISMLVLEAEFASGLTIENHVARGVVDPSSEKDSNNVDFLTVGENGFKVDGIKAEIAAQLEDVVEDLDATVTGTTSGNHVTISIEELDGKLVQSGLTIEENDIASAADLAALSAKTITELTSENDSIDISDGTIADDGTMSFDLITDASKIKMSGFTSTDVLSGITPASSITEAFEEVDRVITENEQTTAAALTDLNTRLETVSGDVETLSAKTITSVTVNNNAVTVANGVAPISITAATSAATATSTEAIVVNTDANGNITLGIANIDCGYYDGTV